MPGFPIDGHIYIYIYIYIHNIYINNKERRKNQQTNKNQTNKPFGTLAHGIVDAYILGFGTG